MLRKNPWFIKKINKQQQCSWLSTNNALVSQTLNIYANAINSMLCNSPTKPLAYVNLPSRKLNLEGFSWQKGYRTPLAFVSFKKTYYKFLQALHLVIRVLIKGGKIYVIFDENQLRPCSSFLVDAHKKNTVKKKAQENHKSFHENQKQKKIESKEKTYGVVTTTLSSYSSQEITSLPLNHNFKDLSSRVSRSLNNRNVYKNHEKKKQYENISWSGDKWVGGTFSNKNQVLKSINLYKTLSRQFFKILERNTFPRYVSLAKKYHGNLFSFKQGPKAFIFSTEQSNKSGFREPLQGNQNQAHQYLRKKGLFNSKNLPDLIIVENAEKHRHVIHEAETLKIPLIAFVESDFLSNISIALPLNKLKHYFLAFLLHIISKMPST